MQNSTVFIVCLHVYGKKIGTAFKKIARINPQYPDVFPSLAGMLVSWDSVAEVYLYLEGAYLYLEAYLYSASN